MAQTSSQDLANSNQHHPSSSESESDESEHNIEVVPKRKKKATSTSGTSGKRPSLALSYSIPENLKKRIISGQFVPLYKLLPGYASGCTSTISSVTEEDGSVKLRLGDSSKDRKLSRQLLTFPQVILSLLKFKVIFC